MRTFREGLFDMLYGALIARAHMAGVRIEDDAARFFVNRALRHIEARRQFESGRYEEAFVAVQNIPKFLDRLQDTAKQTQFFTETAASSAVESIRRTAVGCVYPWCSETP